MQRRVVLVFLKYPAPGRVKTRLASSLGDEAAAAVYRQLVARVFEILASAPIDEVDVLFDPAEAEAAVREWLAPCVGACRAEVKFLAQSRGDLGDRLSRGFRQAFEAGAGAVAAIGTDCVGIDAETFASTWRKLKSADVVFGPSDDGGYYLVAMKSPQETIFEAIPWSSDETLARSLRQAEKVGLEVEKIATLFDVDTAADWEVARAKYFSGSDSSG